MSFHFLGGGGNGTGASTTATAAAPAGGAEDEDASEPLQLDLHQLYRIHGLLKGTWVPRGWFTSLPHAKGVKE